MSPPQLIIWADQGPGVGGGHLGRCLALAQAWRSRGGDVAAVGPLSPGWRDRYAAAGVQRVTTDADSWGSIDAVVLDGYRFASSLQEVTRAVAPLTLVVDYGYGTRHHADLVVDPNIGVDAADYATQKRDARVLAGPRFALLRHETTALIDRPRRSASLDVRRVAIAAGADPDHATRTLADAVERLLRDEIEVARMEGVADVGSFLAASDLVVSAAGTTVLDSLALGRPTVVFACAANQVLVARRCGELGVALDAGDVETTTAEELVAHVRSLIADRSRRLALVDAASSLVDGQGASRVAAHVQSLGLDLRRVELADTGLLFEWANDPVVRRWAFSEEAILPEDHQRWMRTKLASSDTSMFLARDRSGAQIGQIRFDLDSGVAEVSISVAAPHRGRGWASSLIIAGTESLFRLRSAAECHTVRARIKPDNTASVRAFELAGFADEGLRSDGEREWRSYAFPRDVRRPHD
jgi:spore coat polysaccharide biosynthesis predicted glycosyltransferase SpsG/RimJ/RimL family protein N-acetyltransferase